MGVQSLGNIIFERERTQSVRDGIVEQCAEAAADWFTIAPKHRTKERLLQMIREVSETK